jgi:hypothetical protein
VDRAAKAGATPGNSDAMKEAVDKLLGSAVSCGDLPVCGLVYYGCSVLVYVLLTYLTRFAATRGCCGPGCQGRGNA